MLICVDRNPIILNTRSSHPLRPSVVPHPDAHSLTHLSAQVGTRRFQVLFTWLLLLVTSVAAWSDPEKDADEVLAEHQADWCGVNPCFGCLYNEYSNQTMVLYII